MIGSTLTAQRTVKEVSLEDYTAKNEGWEVNIEKAYEMSQKSGKPILANFTGSDWCGNLQRAFKISGYPTIWVFDLSKDDQGQFAISALGKTGYAKTSKDFTNACDKMIAQRKDGE